MKYTFFFIALFAIQFTSNAQKNTNIDKIVAKIDNYYILRSDVEQIIVESKQQGERLDKCKALESIAIQKLLIAKAEIDSVIVEEEMVKNELDSRMAEMSRMYGGEKNIVEQFGKSIETLKADVKKQVSEQLTAQKMQEEITKNSKVTPNEIRKFFSRFHPDSVPTIPSQVEIRQIVRLAKVTKAQKEELIQRLKDIKKQVEKGEDFGTLAELYSEDLGSRQFKGDLGWAKRGQMVPQFEAAAMQLKPNELSDVIESDFGYHLIQTLEIRGQEYHARHILLRPDYNRLDLSPAKNFLDSLKTLIDTDSLSFSKAVQMHSEDDNTKFNGGYISNPQTGTNKLNLDVSMDATLYFMIDTMKVGTISVPLNYRSRDEKTGMRIIYFEKKHEPHPANLKDDYELIQQYALSEKKNRDVEKWFKEAISEVYIKIDPEFEGCKLFESGL